MRGQTTRLSVIDDEMDAERLRRMLLAVCAVIISAEETLCAADRAIGDGDHGIGMRRGFQAAQAALEELRPSGDEDAAEVLSVLSKSLIGEMGGASGVMFGLMFSPSRPGPVVTPAEEALDKSSAPGSMPSGAAPGAEGGSALSVADFAAYMRGALGAVMSRGGARVGDKTMVDALFPAVEALEAAADGGRSWSDALSAAAQAAAQGAEATRALTARFGKARTLGERAIGHRDPGSISVSLIFAAMAGWASSSQVAASTGSASHHPDMSNSTYSGDDR